MKIVKRLQLMKAFFSLVRDPRETDHVFQIADIGHEQRGPIVEDVVKALSRNTQLSKLYEQRYNPVVPPLEQLAQLPDGTLGREFARHMLSNNLDINFFPLPKADDIEHYTIGRGRKSHDFWHILTGFDTSVAGEIGLQAFTLAQIKAPLSAILLAGGILHAVTRAPEIFSDLIDQMFAGYQMGLKAKPLIGVPIETLLDQNLDELRLRFSIEPLSFVNGRNRSPA